MKERVRRLYTSMSPAVAVLGIAVVLFLAVLVILLLTGRADIPAAIMVAAIPVTIGLLGQFVSSDRQNKRQIEADLRVRKSAVYEGFIKFWMDNLMIEENRDKLQTNQNQVVKEMNEYSKAMMLWASNDVVKTYAEYKRTLNQITPESTGKSGIENMIRFEKMIFLMREDVGHDPKGFKQYDLLSFFVNDIHKYDNEGNLVNPIP